MQTVVETPAYLRKAKLVGISDDEREAIVGFLASDPDAGELIQGTEGVRKVRFAKPNAGKSGSYRVISFFHSPDHPVFLLTVYEKGQKVTLSKKERNDLAKLTSTLIANYRAAAPPRKSSHV